MPLGREIYLIAFLGLSSASCAQGSAAGGGRLAAAFEAADVDRNGSVTRSEWLAAGRQERGFDIADANRNGAVTRQELQSAARRFAARRAR